MKCMPMMQAGIPEVLQPAQPAEDPSPAFERGRQTHRVIEQGGMPGKIALTIK